MKFILIISFLFLSAHSFGQEAEAWSKSVVIEGAGGSYTEASFYDRHRTMAAAAAWMLFVLAIGLLNRRRLAAHNTLIQEDTVTALGIDTIQGSITAMKLTAIVFSPVLTYLTLNAIFQ